MAELNKETIRSLTTLSRIGCSEQEQEAILKDLKNILGYMDQLNEIDTSQVPPCVQVLSDIANVMREDQVGEKMPREVFLSNSPQHVGGMIRVPPVIKQG
jgi:aspartyl-tRNA(Asn)/glutamyl-tRNA(Gln) amidotransferase subunit C